MPISYTYTHRNNQFSYNSSDPRWCKIGWYIKVYRVYMTYDSIFVERKEDAFVWRWIDLMNIEIGRLRQLGFEAREVRVDQDV